jgi:hypothetical protein
MRIRDQVSGIFLILDPGSVMGKIRIRDKQSGSATLLFCSRLPTDRNLYQDSYPKHWLFLKWVCDPSAYDDRYLFPCLIS